MNERSMIVMSGGQEFEVLMPYSQTKELLGTNQVWKTDADTRYGYPALSIDTKYIAAVYPIHRGGLDV